MRRISGLPFLFIAVIFYALFISACTIVKIDKNAADGDGEYSTWTKTGTGFQAPEYVESIWESRLIPIYEEQAVDFITVMTALQENRQSGIDQYGLTRQTGEPFYLFKVRGTARVLEYDDSSRNGVIRVDNEPENGVADAVLQVGPVLRGTAIRDSVEFIRFTDIGNQLQFAELAKELNTRMRVESIDPIDLENIEGEQIMFLGAFRLEEEQNLDEVVVTPLVLDLVDGE